jgi:hypothetical protein
VFSNPVDILLTRRFAVIAPRLVRPSSLYSVAVAALPGLESHVQVKAALSRDGVEVAASSREELRPAGNIHFGFQIATFFFLPSYLMEYITQ